MSLFQWRSSKKVGRPTTSTYADSSASTSRRSTSSWSNTSSVNGSRESLSPQRTTLLLCVDWRFYATSEISLMNSSATWSSKGPSTLFFPKVPARHPTHLRQGTQPSRGIRVRAQKHQLFDQQWRCATAFGGDVPGLGPAKQEEPGKIACAGPSKDRTSCSTHSCATQVWKQRMSKAPERPAVPCFRFHMPRV